MNTFISRLHTRVMCVVVALTTLVAACSSGTQVAGGVGSGGSGVAEGTVNGFGSVIVAGVEYDDTNARTVLETADSTTEIAEVKLGQRVRIIQNGKAGVADTIQVLPQLRGPSSSAQDAQGFFQILGQTVQIISTSSTQNTATVLAGLTSVAKDDELEVHGTWVFDSTRGYSILIATRIERLSTAPDPVLVSAVVLERNNNRLTLGDATGHTLQYADLPASLKAQSLVTAWVARNALSNASWQASRVMDASPSLSDNDHLVLNTQVSTRDVAQGDIVVQGMRVKLPSNLSLMPPAVGANVQIQIVRDGSGFKAVALTERQNTVELGGIVELKGGLLWPANPAQLTLRGTSVNVPPESLTASCKNLSSNSNVYLEIKARPSGLGQPLLATSVSCSLQIPSNSVLEASGILIGINPATQTIQIQIQIQNQTVKGPLNFVWIPSSLLPPTLLSLLGRNVEVEYQTINGENRLRKIKPN